LVPAARAQTVQPGRFEVPGLDWGPNAAWRRQARQVRATRQAMLRAGQFGRLNAPPLFALAAPGGAGSSTAVTGDFNVPVIPFAYSDVPAPYSKQAFQDVLFQTTPPYGRPYTLKTYYEELAHGLISMSGRVFDPVRTDSTAEYYQQNCNGLNLPGRTACPDNGKRFGNMLLAALDSISNRPGGDTVWAEFDNDGPDHVPNSGDDDGVVDFVTFLQPVKDGACVPSPGIWAHRWVISVWNGGSPYVTKTPWTGHVGQFIKVENYTIQSEVGGDNGCDASNIMPIGTVAHETGHAFGLPDLYDTQTGTEGIGEWGIMGSGNYAKAYSPAQYDPWSMSQLGWITVAPLTQTSVVTTGPRQLTDTVFMAQTGSSDEYVLVENRQAVHSDSAMFDPNNTASPTGTPPCKSKCRKVPGLLLWHIDDGRILQGQGSNTINTGPIQGVEVEQADGLNNLRSTSSTTRNRGDDGDTWPGATGNVSYGFRTNPGAKTHYNEYDGFVIDQIEDLGGGVMRFRYLQRGLTVVRSNTPGALIRFDGMPWSVYSEALPAGTSFSVGVDSLQETVPGLSRAEFLNWSNGGPREQTIVSGPVPDTLVASFSVEHRLKVTQTGDGLGTVTASVTGDFTTGAFLPAGTPVTLTAAPGGSDVFAGWRGDTTSVATEITLPMNRAYTVEASFVASVAVSLTDATDEILGTAKLSAAQKTFLDGLGNRNGSYDVGDYLALLKRNGQAVPEAVVRALTAAPAGKGQ
jgi:M6 family metalloprotease-like protein